MGGEPERAWKRQNAVAAWRWVTLGVAAALGAGVAVAVVIAHCHPVLDVSAGVATVSADGRAVTVPD